MKSKVRHLLQDKVFDKNLTAIEKAVWLSLGKLTSPSWDITKPANYQKTTRNLLISNKTLF